MKDKEAERRGGIKNLNVLPRNQELQSSDTEWLSLPENTKSLLPNIVSVKVKKKAWYQIICQFDLIGQREKLR